LGAGPDRRVGRHGRSDRPELDARRRDGWTVQNEPPKNNVIQLGREVHTGQLRMADRFVSRYADG
jgi:hypothetical protein